MCARAAGAAISVDGGATFKAYDAKLTCDARYGAFPTDDIWYVAAGDWPSNVGRSEFLDANGHALPRAARKALREQVEGTASSSSSSGSGQYIGEIAVVCASESLESSFPRMCTMPVLVLMLFLCIS
jgi:hypothetical protein